MADVACGPLSEGPSVDCLPASTRPVYRGGAETSIYVGEGFRGRGRQGVDPQTVGEAAVVPLASYKCPTAIAVVTELPRNASGKVLKTELRTT